MADDGGSYFSRKRRPQEIGKIRKGEARKTYGEMTMMCNVGCVSLVIKRDFV